MADARVDILGIGDVPLVTQLYNQIFKPRQEEEFFRRRFEGRHNSLILAAVVDGDPVGFSLGFENKPTVFFEWLYGVLPDYRRAGIGAQLMDASNAWAKENHYHSTRMECHNQHREMLHMAIAKGYDIAGIRWEPERHSNLVIFEKELAE